MKCPYCDKVFDSKRGLANHKRWHPLPQYEKFQKSYKLQVSEFNAGEKNGRWKGNNVSKSGLHKRIIRQQGTPLRCDDCNEIKPLDLANISQEYKFDLDDWEWLCRKCHMVKDGRLDRLNGVISN